MPLFRIAGKNVLFIHVPKTGGTSVEQAMAAVAPMGLHSLNSKAKRLRFADGLLSRQVPLQHFHKTFLEDMFAPSLVDYAFMIVRDPVSRMVSEFKHSKVIGRIETRLGFSRWLRLQLVLNQLLPNHSNNHFRPQADFLCFGARVFRFEDGLQCALDEVGRDLGVKFPEVPHARRSEADAVSVSPRDRALIARAYGQDYAQFGFSRPEGTR